MADKETLKDPQWLFESLQKTLANKPSVAERVRLHVLAKTGYAQIAAYHNNGASTEEKVEIYKFCLKSAITGDVSGLLVPANGDAAIVPSRDSLANPPTPSRVIELDEVKPEPRNVVPVDPKPVPAPTMGGLESIIAAAIAPFLKAQAGVDEGKVREIVDGIMADTAKALEAKVDAFLGKIPPRDTLVIQNGESTKELSGLYHWQLPQVITWISADVPLWLWGKAGGGKTTFARQVGEALDLPVTVISVDPTMTIGKLLGYRNLSNGEFVEGWLYKPFKDGGLVAFDEIDTGDPGILAAVNALIANGHYLFPNGETVKRHPRFRIMAGANTKGTGAVAGYTARNRLDAATLNRFAILELEYDMALTKAIALKRPKAPGGKQWKASTPATDELCERFVDWVEKAMGCVGSSVLISPRAPILGVQALLAGVPLSEVIDSLVFGLAMPDTRKNVSNQIGALNE